MAKAFVLLALACAAGCIQAEPRVDQTAGRYYGETPVKQKAAMDRMLKEANAEDPVIYISPEAVAK